jgi:integrase
MTAPRRKSTLPIRQRHRTACRKPRSGCDCPWYFRGRDKVTGQQVARQFDSYAEAERSYIEWKTSKPGAMKDRTTTWSQWAVRAMEMGEAKGLAPNTLEGRKRDLHCHILPFFGDRKVWDTRGDEYWSWIRWMSRPDHTVTGRDGIVTKGPVSNSSQHSAAEWMRTMQTYWTETGHEVERGCGVPPGLVKLQPPRSRAYQPWTPEEAERIALAHPPEMRFMSRLQAYCGSRCGEIRATRLDHFTFIGLDVNGDLLAQWETVAEASDEELTACFPTLTIDRQLDRSRSEAKLKNPGNGRRTLPLDRAIVADLVEQLRRWPVPDWSPYLFTNPDHGAGRAGYGPTIHDVARLAGTSEGQVGRVFTDKAYGGGTTVSPATRARIEEAATTLRWPRQEPYSGSIYRTRFHQAVRNAGLEDRLPPGQALHAYRHHCASVLSARGFPAEQIGYWIGDAALTVSKIYIKQMDGSLTTMAERLAEARAEARAGAGQDRKLRAVR